MQFVTNMRGDVLGSIGLAFLVYTVITTIQKVEASFNFVWRVERPRSFARRFTEYLSVMILAPILLAVIVGGSGRFFGPVLGSVVVVLLPEWLRFLQDWYLAIFGFSVIVLMVFLPGGLLSLADRFKFGRSAQ